MKKISWATVLAAFIFATVAYGTSNYVAGVLGFAPQAGFPSSCPNGCIYSFAGNLFARNASGFDTPFAAFGEPFNAPLTSRAAGTYYIFGGYEWATTSVTLDETTTQTWGAAAVAHNSHAGAVVQAAGTTSTTCSLVVTGASYDPDTGVINGADSETIIADVTAAVTGTEYSGSKLWLGTITYDLVSDGTCGLTFNYGFSRVEDGANVADLEFNGFRCEGTAGANDTSFDIEIIHDKKTGWTYAASGFVPGPTAEDTHSIRFAGYDNLVSGDSFTYLIGSNEIATERISDPDYFVVRGTIGEGLVIRVTTGAVNSIRNLNCFTYVKLGYQN